MVACRGVRSSNIQAGKLTALPSGHRIGAKLAAEDFLYLADFALNFAADPRRRAAVLKIGVAGRAPRFLFYLARDFLRPPFRPVLCA